MSDRVLSRRRLAVSAAVAGVVMSVFSPVRAQSIWTNNDGAGDGQWNTASNWLPAGVPGASADAQFTAREIESITLGAPTTIGTMTFNQPAGTFAFGGAGLTVSTAGPTALQVQSGTARFDNALTLAAGANAIVGGSLTLTNGGNSLGNNTVTVGTGGRLVGLTGYAAGTNSLNNSTVTLDGGNARLVGSVVSGIPTQGFFAREYPSNIGAYTYPFGGNNVTTAVNWASTPHQAIVYTNLAGTNNIPANNPASVITTSVIGATQTFARFYAPYSGIYTFRSNTDDGGRMIIDGVPVTINEGGHGAQAALTPVYLTAGYHNIETQLLNSGTGYQWEFTVTQPNTTANAAFPLAQSFVVSSGLAGTINAANFSSTNVSVAAGATGGLSVELPDLVPQMNIGTTAIGAGSTLNVTTATPGNFSTVRGAGITFANAAQTLNIAANLSVAPGTTAGGGASAVITKLGKGELLLDSATAGTVAAGTTLDIQEGVVRGQAITGGGNPFGASMVLRLNSATADLATLKLDTRNGDFTFANPIVAQGIGGRIEATNAGRTFTLSGTTTLSGSAGLTLQTAHGNNLATATAGATLTLSGVITSGATNTINVVSLMRNQVGSGTTLPRQFNGNFGTVRFTGANAITGSTIQIGSIPGNSAGQSPGFLEAAADSNNTLGTAAINLDFGRLFLKRNGAGSNSTINFGNNVRVTGGLGSQIDVNRNGGTNTNNGISINNLTIDSVAPNNPQGFSYLAVTGANGYRLEVAGVTSINGNVQVDSNLATNAADLVLVGGISGTGSFTKTSFAATTAGFLTFGGTSTYSLGAGNHVVVAGGGIRVGSGAGSSAQLSSNVYSVAAGGIVADNNSTAATSGFTGTVQLRNFSVLRLEQNDPTLPTLDVSQALAGTPNTPLLSLNTATFSQTIAMPAAANLFLGSGQATVQYTGGTIVPNAQQYLLGGTNIAAASALRLTGDGVNAVLADSGGVTSARIGSRLFVAMTTAANASTVRFDSLIPNTYTGTTFIDSGFVADVQVGGANTALGTGAVTVAGTLLFTGPGGSAVNSGDTANNNSGFTFRPGSALTFAQTALPTTTGGMWHDTTAVALDGTTLTLQGAATLAAAETIGNLSFNSGSAVVVNKNTGTSAGLTIADLVRTSRGTLRIATGTASNPLGTAGETMNATGVLPATIGAAGILPAYVIAQNNTIAPSFVVPTAGALSSLAAYSGTDLNTAGATDVTDVTAATLVSGPRTVAAARIGAFAVTSAAAANRVIIGTAGGGLIFSGTATHTAAFDFGANEGLVFVNGGAIATLTNAGSGLGGILGTNGLTKSGLGALVINNAALGTAASAITGGVTLNEGTLQLGVPTGTSTTVPIPATNDLTVNGGTLTLRNDVTATYFNNTTVRGSFAYDIGRAGGTTANPNFRIGNSVTLGESGRADTLTISGTVNGSPNLYLGATGGTVTLNQDVVFSAGRVAFDAPITGNNKSIFAVGGANVFFRNYTNTGLSSVVIRDGVLVLDGTTNIGAPVTMMGTTSNYGGQAQIWQGTAATLPNSFHIYSGTRFTGTSAMTYTPGAGNTFTIGVPEQPGPVTLDVVFGSNTANTTVATRIDNASFNFTSFTISSATNGVGTSFRQFVLNQGTGVWNISGPIELQNNNVLSLIVPNVAASGDIAPALTRLTTLRANVPAGGLAEFALSTTGANTARVAFSQTILDSDLRIDPTGPAGGLTVGTSAHVSLGSILVNGDRTLRIFDAANLANTANAVDFGSVYGTADSILRLAGSGVAAGNFLLTTDQTSTMLGTIFLSNAQATSAWTLQTSGALGAQGVIGNAVRLDIPASTTVSAKDNILIAAGGTMSGRMEGFTVNGPAGGARLTLDAGAVLGHVASGSLGPATSLATTRLPQGLTGHAAIAELRLLSDVNANLAGNDTAITATLGGSNALASIANDGTARTITSGNITVAGPFLALSRNSAAGNALLFGGTTAGNRIVNFLPDAGLPAVAKGDMILSAGSAFAPTFHFGNNGTGGVAGDLSGIRRVLVTGGPNNQATTAQGQAGSALGGTGVTKPTFLAMFAANATLNSLDPGPATPVVGGAFAAGNTTTITGDAIFQANGRLLLNDANNVTSVGAGSWTFQTGSVIEVSNATAVQGLPATVNFEPGVILRLSADNVTNFAGLRTNASVIMLNGTRTQNSAITLDRDPSVAASGMLSTTTTGTFNNTAGVSVGANGAILAAAGGTTLTYGGTLTTSDRPVQIGEITLTNGNAAQQTGTFAYTGASVFGASPINITAAATLATPAASVAATNNFTIDGSLSINNGTAQVATIGQLASTGRAALRTTTGAGSELIVSSLGTRTNRGLYDLRVPTAAALGGNEKIIISSGAPLNVGTTAIVSPIYFNTTDFQFVAHNNADGGNGFTNVAGVAYASATSNDVATIAAALATAGETRAALLINNSGAGFTVSGTGVTLATGGVAVNTGGGTAPVTISTPINFGGNEAVFWTGLPAATGGQLVNLAGATLTNANGFTKAGTNSLVITSVIPTGAGALGVDPIIAIQQSNLRLGVANALPTDSILQIGAAGVFDMFNFPQTVAGINGSGIINNQQGTSSAVQTLTLGGSGNYSFAGLFIGGAAATDLVKNGTGTQTFTNNLTSSLRNVTINSGVVNINGSSTLGGLMTVVGGTLNWSGNGWLNGLTVRGGTTNITGRSVILGNSSSINVTNGTLNLSGPATESVLVTGSVNVSGGSLTMNAAASHYVLGATNFTQPTAASNVTINGAYNVFAGQVLFQNNGTVSINGVNTFNNTVLFRQGGTVSFGVGSTSVFNGPQPMDFSAITTGLQQFNSTLTVTSGVANVDPAAVRVPGATGLVTIGDSFGSAAASLLAVGADQTVDRPIATGRGAGLFTLGSTAASGTTTFSGSVTLFSDLTVTSAAGGNVLLSGVVSGDSSGSYGLRKTGGGVVTITAANTYPGGTVVSDGTLLANNVSGSATGPGAVVVNQGGTIGGNGSIAGPLTVTAGGRVSPGTSPGVLSVSAGAVSMAINSTLVAEVNGLTVGTQYDQLNVTGAVDIAGGDILLTLGYTPADGDSVTLIANDGADPITGAGFSTINGFTLSTIGAGQTQASDGTWIYTLTYTGNFTAGVTTATPGSGNDLVLSLAAVPEPTSLAALALAGMGLLARRRRRA